MKRHKDIGLDISTNYNDILTAINNHVTFADVEKPNQTDPKYITYDIACNEDFALHHKFYQWEKIFDYFKEHPTAKATLATKYIPINFLDYNPNKKVRIRFSLMPQKLSDVLEPNTEPIIDRIKAVNAFIEAGYEVHLNFSPVVIYDNWKEDYDMLFNMVNDYVEYKDEVKAEVIFLTHNESKHYKNLKEHANAEQYLWSPTLQEDKVSEYGGKNIRYKASLKADYIKQFKELHNSIIPWNTIRYIF
jgi:spore photoproduct lyase